MNELQTKDLFDVDPFDLLFRHPLALWRGRGPEIAPQIRIDLSEDDKQYLVKADIPGVRKEDIDVRIDGNQVTISAEIKRESEEKKDGRVLRRERQVGYATRSFALASPVDQGKAEAKYDNGVLTVAFPKASGASTKRISVS